MMLPDAFPSLQKKYVVNDKDSEQRNGILCQAQRMYIGKNMKKAWIILTKKMF